MSTSEQKRWEALSKFGIERPSGTSIKDLVRDLTYKRRILCQRGLNINEFHRVDEAGTRKLFSFIASSDGIKRDGNEIVNSGWLLENFRKNPVFLWCHDYSLLPLGRCPKQEIIDYKNGKALRIYVEFADGEDNEMAPKVMRLYEKGFLNAVSVGWDPVDWEWRTIGDDFEYLAFLLSDLLELSGVTVPADPEGLVESRSRLIEARNARILTDEDLKKFEEMGAMGKLSDRIAYVLSNSSITSKERVSPEVQVESSVPVEAPVETVKPETEAVSMKDEIIDSIRGFVEEIGNRIDKAIDNVNVTVKVDTSELSATLERMHTMLLERLETPAPELSAVEQPTEVEAETRDFVSDDTQDDGNCACGDDAMCYAECLDKVNLASKHCTGLSNRMEGAKKNLLNECLDDLRACKEKLDKLMEVTDETEDETEEEEGRKEESVVTQEVETQTRDDQDDQTEIDLSELERQLADVAKEFGVEKVESVETPEDEDDVMKKLLTMLLD